jgi:predicted transcriptional regulator
VSKRRTASELAALSEQLYEVIAAHPGEGMVTLSERMGANASTLQRAVARLRGEERIRTVGARQQMRYFPRA